MCRPYWPILDELYPQVPFRIASSGVQRCNRYWRAGLLLLGEDLQHLGPAPIFRRRAPPLEDVLGSDLQLLSLLADPLLLAFRSLALHREQLALSCKAQLKRLHRGYSRRVVSHRCCCCAAEFVGCGSLYHDVYQDEQRESALGGADKIFFFIGLPTAITLAAHIRGIATSEKN